MKKRKLISIPKSKISKMTEHQLMKQFIKAEHEVAFTDATWSNLLKQHDNIIRKSR